MILQGPEGNVIERTSGQHHSKDETMVQWKVVHADEVVINGPRGLAKNRCQAGDFYGINLGHGISEFHNAAHYYIVLRLHRAMGLC